GLGAARLVTRDALSDLDAIRSAVDEVGEGAREVNIPVQGHGELATLAADLRAMVAKLDAAERARRQLVTSDSDDLRTPLTAITPARANPEQLQRVLFNLIQNAIRHTPPDGSVVVRSEPASGRPVGIEVEIADTGSGIEPQLRERIFEPFAQGPSRVAGTNGS